MYFIARAVYCTHGPPRIEHPRPSDAAIRVRNGLHESFPEKLKRRIGKVTLLVKLVHYYADA